MSGAGNVGLFLTRLCWAHVCLCKMFLNKIIGWLSAGARMTMFFTPATVRIAKWTSAIVLVNLSPMISKSTPVFQILNMPCIQTLRRAHSKKRNVFFDTRMAQIATYRFKNFHLCFARCEWCLLLLVVLLFSFCLFIDHGCLKLNRLPLFSPLTPR